VDDVKALQGVVYVFLPVPVFWSLFDQQVIESLPLVYWHKFVKNTNTISKCIKTVDKKYQKATQ